MEKHGKLEVGTSVCDCGNEATRLEETSDGALIAKCGECLNSLKDSGDTLNDVPKRLLDGYEDSEGEE